MAEIDIVVDDLTNSIIHQPTGEVFATRIVPWRELGPDQRAALDGWRFDWAKEANRALREVVALLIDSPDTIQGLISIESKKGFIYVNLIESAPHNVGRNQLFRGVAGNLFAYACMRSFAAGFDGFLAFDAKTELIEHYKVSLGAQQAGSSHRMIFDNPAALDLVERYYTKETDRWP